MTCSFPLVGRLGNLMFIYAHARAYCEQAGYDLCLPPWIGEKIFTIPEAVRSHKPDIVMPEALYQNQQSLIYTKRQVREWFQIKPEILQVLSPLLEDRKPVTVNIRSGEDYLRAGLVCLSRQCYADQAIRLGFSPFDCELETDILPTRMSNFEGDEHASGLGTSWLAIPSFYVLMTARILLRANSTFSWWAATLSEGKIYSPVIKGIKGGMPDQYCPTFVEGNWPVMADAPQNSDLHLPE